MEFEKSDKLNKHTIESNNLLVDKHTGRVVAAFYNDYDLDHVIDCSEKAITENKQPKIIQFSTMPNDAYYQGMIIGLGDDGVLYAQSNEGWEVYVPLEFKK